MNIVDNLKLAVYESGFDDETTTDIISNLEEAYEYGTAQEFVECVNTINEILVSEGSANADTRIGGAMYGAGRVAATGGTITGIAAIKKALDARSLTKKIQQLENMKLQYRLAKDTQNVKLIDDEIRELKKNHAEAVRKAKKYGLIGVGVNVGGNALANLGATKYANGQMNDVAQSF